MALQLTPLHPLFAAEVGGLDLRTTPGPEVCAEIDRAMDRYAGDVLPGRHGGVLHFGGALLGAGAASDVSAASRSDADSALEIGCLDGSEVGGLRC